MICISLQPSARVKGALHTERHIRLSWLPAPNAVQGVMSSWKGVKMGMTAFLNSAGGRSVSTGNAGACRYEIRLNQPQQIHPITIFR